MAGAAKKPGGSPLETPTGNARVSEIEELARRELSEREFEAWHLVEVLDHTASEAGLAMSSSDSAVRGLLLRGRSKLVLRLGES